jgi:hypothetical protein
VQNLVPMQNLVPVQELLVDHWNQEERKLLVQFVLLT